MLHLFDQKYTKTVILWNIITIQNNSFLFEYTLKYNLFLWLKDERSSAIAIMFHNIKSFSVFWSKNADFVSIRNLLSKQQTR